MKKLIFRILFIPFFLVIEGINWLSILIDELFFFSYKKIVISSPVYITGMPRTATTYMYNILNRDTERFTSMKLWEIAFAPSIFQKKILIYIKKLDDKSGQPLINFLKYIEKPFFKKFQSFHPLSLFNVEEDEYLLLHNFSSGLLVFFFPSIKKVFSKIPKQKRKSTRGKELQFYRNCVKKHLYVFGKNRTYLAKSPAHILRYKLLKKVFPDLKMICMLRVPHKTIPSTISLFSKFNLIFHSRLNNEGIIDNTLLMADQSYKYLIELYQQNKNQAFKLVQFERFIENPEIEIMDIYQKFQYQISEEFLIRLKLFCLQNSTFISKHKYSLKEYDLDLDRLINRYSNIYTTFYKQEISTFSA